MGYGLGPVGNRTGATSSISGLAPVSGTFNSDDELGSETYDSNGNVIAQGGKTFTYDAENHLLSMGATVGLMYDGDGNRVAKSVSGVTTYYLVDDLNPTGYPQVVEELSSAGAVTRQYTYGLQRISQQQSISNTWTPSFYGYDGGGSVRAMTNAAGAVTVSYNYDGFGNQISSTGSTPNSYLYRGEAYDSDLGLYYLRARYYNPLTGRFMSRDPDDHSPMSPNDLHKYLYANGDPVNGTDPTGRGDEEEDAGADIQSIFQTVRYADALRRKDILLYNCFTLGLQAAIDKATGQKFTEGVPLPFDLACLFLIPEFFPNL